MKDASSLFISTTLLRLTRVNKLIQTYMEGIARKHFQIVPHIKILQETTSKFVILHACEVTY